MTTNTTSPKMFSQVASLVGYKMAAEIAAKGKLVEFYNSPEFAFGERWLFDGTVPSSADEKAWDDFCDSWYGVAKEELYDVYSDPDGEYHYDTAPHDGNSNYIGTRYQWVATFNSAEEAEKYAEELNSNRPELAD